MTLSQWFLLAIAIQEALGGAMYLFVDNDWRRAVIWVAYAIATLLITF